MPLEQNKFAKVSEKDVTQAILGEYLKELSDHIESDAVVIGGGPSGLICARDLAREGKKVVLIEANNYLGGGFWLGGYLMNPVTFRAPSDKVLTEIGIPFRQCGEGLFVANGPHACSKLIVSSCEAGVCILNMTKFDDVVIRNDKVEGVVINWTPVGALPRAITCVDPIAIETGVVIDATGHDAVVVGSLQKRSIIEPKGFGAMDVETSEDAVVENTKEVYPGLIVTGMAVSTMFGLPRMGPTFGGMLMSGKRAAVIASRILDNNSGQSPSSGA